MREMAQRNIRSLFGIMLKLLSSGMHGNIVILEDIMKYADEYP